MSEKGILFSGEMVRAILEGRKTQTRRIIRPQPLGRICYILYGDGADKWKYPDKDTLKAWGDEWSFVENLPAKEQGMRWTPPCHAEDYLYVRETFSYWFYDRDLKRQLYYYKANYPDFEKGIYPDGWDSRLPSTGGNRWYPSIHMPKSAARIWLYVDSVHVERLQDISEDDAAAEGVDTAGLYPVSAEFGSDIHRHAFSRLWDSCYGPGAWKKNPWVWVIMFRKIEEEK